VSELESRYHIALAENRAVVVLLPARECTIENTATIAVPIRESGLERPVQSSPRPRAWYMNADDRAHWLRPSPPIAVDGDSPRETDPNLEPSEPPEITTPETTAEERADHKRTRTMRLLAHHCHA
jgi:hypothetical protein